MAPRPRWWHQLQSSKNEARLAIDLYNRSGSERQLEAFIVHMSMAWLRLMQARTEMTEATSTSAPRTTAASAARTANGR